MTPREIERYRDGELTETEYESTGYALVRASRFAMSLGMSTLVAFGALEYFGGVMSAPATRPTAPSAANVWFYSDWADATGTGAAAVMDSSKAVAWPRFQSGIEVISAAGLGFPAAMSNVVQINTDDGNSWTAFDAADQIVSDTLDAVGETRAWRFYIHYALNQGTPTDSNTHGLFAANSLSAAPSVAMGYPSDLNIGFEIEQSVNTAFSLRLQIPGNLTPSSRNEGFYSSTDLANDTTWLVEVKVTVISVSPDSVFVQARVYDESDVLVLSDANFGNSFSTGTTLNDSVPLIVSNGHSTFNSMWVGLNGFTGGAGELYHYIGGVVMCDDWCGPYPIAGVEN